MSGSSTAGTEPLLVARDIRKQYGGVIALDGVSLTLHAGEVHCLAGENGSGKSTLIKIMSGVEVQSAGTITVDGRPRAAQNPRDAMQEGIDVIFQDLALFPNLTVAENIAITSVLARRKRTVSLSAMRTRAAAIVSELGIDLDIDAYVEDLTIADRQLTAICRSLAKRARVIFMDEPTTALTRREVDNLLVVVERLRAGGAAIVFVSHKLDEVLAVSQRVTVLRNGSLVAEGDAADFTPESISRAMTGRDLAELTPTDTVRSEGRPALSVQALTLGGAFEAIDLDVHPGEILGLTGLLGSGRTEIAEAIMGLAPADSGTVTVGARTQAVRSIRDALDLGLGYVPGDRLSQGLFIERSISDNMIVGTIAEQTKAGFISRQKVDREVSEGIAGLTIKAASAQAPVSSLSGGNQQRVVLARELARRPVVLLLNSPTVGVDVGSKEGILEALQARAAEGMAIVIISDDVSELVSVCHRVVFIKRGRVGRSLTGSAITVDDITKELAA
ncbi:MAG: lipase [Microbacterium sp. SCN 70-18]|uniref:Sugar ABC transporter ATP-binding protein n=1 Tax=Microbacterium aurantiacum TaxID=162393 RepID=A0AAJ2HIS7_9MICO|nr:sugar ABC transporter ATP-binding protein [Microbacterium aurantiacum]MBN9201263.1 sugar ABC transporter ATP-binding protein [Microbacterium chocolatum]MDS0245285.1 sugar ABC transporter ATP-binding protein [Microbacterium aurantiacum]ODT11998.1 MAG: lipase [Microbacterium sp. SCN 70-18]